MIVCSATKCFCMINPNIILMTLITPIMHIHVHNHIGISNIGKNFIRQITTNTKSAKVSSLEPNSLTVFIFLATVPSIISVNPANRYKAINLEDNTGQNSNRILQRILQPVIIFAILMLLHLLNFYSFFHIFKTS